jgi:ABC-type multidrug transport system ATPase subunit
VCGFDVRRQGKAARRAIGYVPQEIAFYDDLRVGAALALFARLKKAPFARIQAVLDEVGLSDQRRKRVRELSGGMKQRLALASALLADPPVLVLDELTSNLDASAQSAFMDLLLHLKDGGKTILFTSHHFDEVRTLADRVLIMDRGRIVREALPGDVETSHATSEIIKLTMDTSALERALQALSASGFEARRNGCGVLVTVRDGGKMRAIEAVHAADITITDFHFVSRRAFTNERRKRS